MPVKKKTAAEATTKKTVKKTAASAAKPKAAAEIKKTAIAAEEDKPVKKTVRKTTAKKAPAEAKKAVVKEEVKAPEAAPVKEEVKPVEAAPVKEEVKPVEAAPVKEEAKAPAKKAAAKKAPAKKAAPAKKEAKAAPVKEEVKEEVKAAPVKEEVKEEVKAAPVKEEVKEEAKAAPVKKEVKEEVKAAPAEEVVVEEAAVPVVEEAVVEEAVPAQPLVDLTDEKIAFYSTLDDGTRVEMMKALGIQKDMNTLKAELAKVLDVPAYIEELIIENVPKDIEVSFDDEGYDVSVVPFTVESIYNALPVKAIDTANLTKKIETYANRQLTADALSNAELYNTLFDLVRDVLVTGQRNNFHTLKEVEEKMPGDLRKLIVNFMDVAYGLLPSWQYKDVKYYQGFLYSVLSQFNDLADLHNRAMMDTADLYIKHGDYGRGDADYNYVIRENALKDYIYYRFANVYRPIDLQKAKAIAGSALQYVDGRYTYYPNIMEILHS